MLNTGRLAGKVLYISGASRGIGLEFAKKAAKDGAKVAIAAKTAEPHPKLPGTIYTAAKEIEALGGTALPLIVDVRSEADIQKSVEDTMNTFSISPRPGSSDQLRLESVGRSSSRPGEVEVRLSAGGQSHQPVVSGPIKCGREQPASGYSHL